ncbi:hypothetical protein E5163_14960 [Marinicauda algicola]|uniref:GATA-type domain-containing protein n=1 Tax=Marinicauda algicola TaxID=2029849 RepID=A0A4S2GWC7_9PROT|nr:hypothetical protein [Marinicauda algicola]TGY87366.1 hypothetical protein E5163_14960 [Marinicauda algicola]
MKTPTCAHALATDPQAWPTDAAGRAPCGACGQWHKPFRLVDVRAHLLTGLRPLSFLCDGCVSRLIRPGRKAEREGVRPVPKSAFIRGLPGETATRLAHQLRRTAKDRPELDRLP